MEDGKFHTNNNQHKYRYFNRASLQGVLFSKNNLFKKPKEHQVAGDIRLGYIYNAKMIFCIQLKELTQHLLLVGRSGSGKSNILRLIQTELHRLGIPFLIFDTAKYGSRFFKHYMKDLIILRWNKDFFFNPLINQPGTQLKEWVLSFCDITTDNFGLRTASKIFMTDFLLNRVFKNYEIDQSSKYPTMHDFHYELEKRLREKIPRNEREYINAIIGKVRTICTTLDAMINVQEGIPIEELLKYPVCIELVGIKNSEIQYWIISLILAAIASYREAREMSFGELKHVIFFDEAAKILGKGEK